MGCPGYVRTLVCAAVTAIVCAAGGAARAASSPSIVMPDGSVRDDYGRRPGALRVLVGTPLVDAERADATLAPGELPVVVRVADSGAARPVNFRVVGSTDIIDGRRVWIRHI